MLGLEGCSISTNGRPRSFRQSFGTSRHLQRIGREVLSRNETVFTTYGPPSGEIALRRQIGRQLLTIGVHAAGKPRPLDEAALTFLIERLTPATEPLIRAAAARAVSVHALDDAQLIRLAGPLGQIFRGGAGG